MRTCRSFFTVWASLRLPTCNEDDCGLFSVPVLWTGRGQHAQSVDSDHSSSELFVKVSAQNTSYPERWTVQATRKFRYVKTNLHGAPQEFAQKVSVYTEHLHNITDRVHTTDVRIFLQLKTSGCEMENAQQLWRQWWSYSKLSKDRALRSTCLSRPNRYSSWEMQRSPHPTPLPKKNPSPCVVH